jgi:Txe/YoeB family toxin of Txe-Axe toxin-antitoxin module
MSRVYAEWAAASQKIEKLIENTRGEPQQGNAPPEPFVESISRND